MHRQNVGYEITALGRKDVLLETGNQERAISFGEYSFHGALAHIHDAGEPMAGYLLIDAQLLARDGRLLFSAPGPIEAIEFAVVMRSGQVPALDVMTESDVSGIKILAPGVKNVMVNGKDHEFLAEGEYVKIR